MNLRRLSLAIGVLGLCAAAAAWLGRTRPQESTDPRVGKPLLEASLLEKAGRVRLHGPQGAEVSLERQRDGSWVVVNYHGLPADFGKLGSLTEPLLRTQVERFVTSNPERIARYEFKDSRLQLEDEKGGTLWSLQLGKETETGAKLLKFGEEARAYQARLSVWLDTAPRNWADTRLLSWKPADIARIELGLEQGASLVLVRAGKEAPFKPEAGAPAGTLRKDKLDSLLQTLCELRFAETSAPSDPEVAEARPHLRKVVLTQFDGRSMEVLVGRRPERTVLKAEAKPADPAKAGPAALLAAAPLGKAEGDKAKGAEDPAAAAAELAKTETIPPGPVFVFLRASDAKDPVNTLMEKRAFQLAAYVFANLPAKAEELLEINTDATPVQPPSPPSVTQTGGKGQG